MDLDHEVMKLWTDKCFNLIREDFLKKLLIFDFMAAYKEESVHKYFNFVVEHFAVILVGFMCKLQPLNIVVNCPSKPLSVKNRINE